MTAELTARTLDLIAEHLPSFTTVALRDHLYPPPRHAEIATFIDKRPHGIFLLSSTEHDPVADPEHATAHLAELALNAVRTQRRRLHGIGMSVQVIHAPEPNKTTALFATLIAF